jgi:putative ABC transport system permease protein
VEDAAFLRREVTGVRRVLPEFSVSTEVASVRGRRIARVMGGTSASLRARGLELATGRLATEDDDLTGARVCLLEVRLARELLGTEAPALVRLGTRVFAVIGTFRGRRAPEASVLGELPDLVVPGSSLRGSGELLSRLIVEVDPAMAPSVAARRIERALLDRRRGVANVSVLWPERLLAERRRADRAIWGVLVGSAALCLLVGVAGISNTMLATLAERRREIGIQRALGASARRVFRLVLLEAVALSALGGAIGLAAGLVAVVGARLVGGTALAASPSSIAVALPLILGLGVVAGLYPARRASSVEPAEMLRI